MSLLEVKAVQSSVKGAFRQLPKAWQAVKGSQEAVNASSCGSHEVWRCPIAHVGKDPIVGTSGDRVNGWDPVGTRLGPGWGPVGTRLGHVLISSSEPVLSPGSVQSWDPTPEGIEPSGCGDAVKN